jgi:hypothetical protein
LFTKSRHWNEVDEESTSTHPLYLIHIVILSFLLHLNFPSGHSRREFFMHFSCHVRSLPCQNTTTILTLMLFGEGYKLCNCSLRSSCWPPSTCFMLHLSILLSILLSVILSLSSFLNHFRLIIEKFNFYSRYIPTVRLLYKT